MSINQSHKCLICKSSSFNEIYAKTLLKCNSCGFITANISIGEDELKKIYTSNYFHGEEYLNYLKDKPAINKNFRKRIKKINNIVKKEITGKILEIGCAYGFFGSLIKEKNTEIDYTGIDVVPEAIEYAQKELKLNAICGDYLNYYSDKKFGFVFMWDVIEHIQYPNLFIEKIKNEQEKGDYLLITTSDIDSKIARIKKEKWRMIHPPSHLHYFSRRTLIMLLELNGYEIISASYPFFYRSMKQIFYSLFVLNKKSNALIRFLYLLIPEKIHIPFNTFDIMFIIAQKKS